MSLFWKVDYNQEAFLRPYMEDMDYKRLRGEHQGLLLVTFFSMTEALLFIF